MVFKCIPRVVLIEMGRTNIKHVCIQKNMSHAEFITVYRYESTTEAIKKHKLLVAMESWNKHR